MPQNRKNYDGSVNSYYKTKQKGAGYSVDFYSKDFKDEIEENIFEAVLFLNSKGYTTVTSCHGHSRLAHYFCNTIRYTMGPQVTLKLPYNVKIPSTLFVQLIPNDTMENDEIYYYTKICIRPWLEIFFTNKFLCSIITRYCERLPIVYDIN